MKYIKNDSKVCLNCWFETNIYVYIIYLFNLKMKQNEMIISYQSRVFNNRILI